MLRAGNGKLALQDCKLASGGSTFELSGTAAYNRNLDLRLSRTGGPAYSISGSLEKPDVQALNSPVTQAQAR